MSKKICWALLVVSLVVGVSAVAGQRYVDIEQRLSPEQMHAAGLDTLSPAQLLQLNEILRGEAEANASMPESQKTIPASDQGSLLGLDVEPIRSRVKGSVSSWEPGTVFELANGQKWKVLKGYMKLRQPLDGPEILLVPGIAGRWFLQVDEDLPKARVYRID